MVKQRNEASDSVTQQVQSRDILYLKKSNKFTFGITSLYYFIQDSFLKLALKHA